MKPCVGKFTLVLAFLLANIYPTIARAADLSVVPSVSLWGEYTNNLNYDFERPLSEFTLSLRPAAEFNYTTDIGQLQGRLGLTGWHYFQNSHADHIDQNYQINGWYQLTPRLKFTMHNAYIVDSSLQEELTVSGLIMSRTPRESVLLGPGLRYALTERISATARYGFTQVNYQDPRFNNYSGHHMNLGLAYALKNQRTVLSWRISGNETTYANNNSSRYIGTYSGINHKFSEVWLINFLGGLDYYSNNFQKQVLVYPEPPFFIQVSQTGRRTGVAPHFLLSTTRQWTKAVLTIGYRRDQPASGLGTMVATDSVFSSLSYKFSERLTGWIGGSYYSSQAQQGGSNYESSFYQVKTRLTYRVTEKLSLIPGYSFGLRQQSGRSANRHGVTLMMTYSYPLHYQK
jgi:hypothetical protein